MLFMGIDAGTQGVRAIVTDTNGEIITAESKAYSHINLVNALNQFEQSAKDWDKALSYVVKSCVEQLKNKRIDPERIVSISVDGTSGTVLPVDKQFEPIMNAVMYNDARSISQAKAVKDKASDLEEKCGYQFNTSFALPKILWIKEQIPDIYDHTYVFLHQTDYIIGRICGEYCTTDYSNALKTGFDIVDGCWPKAIERLEIDLKKLPRVVAPGTPIGKVTERFANESGLKTTTAVIAGATDGYASALAAGTINAGDWASIIGTTLVTKVVTEHLIIDKDGSSYSHKMPSGMYMLGGASNVGGKSLDEKFAKTELNEFNAFVDALSPTSVIMYPLVGKGERFPFLDPEAKSFIKGDISDRKILYTALMEGVGYTERLAMDRMRKMGVEIGDEIYTSGGACRSNEWLRMRASILNKRLKVPGTIEAAMGSALLAASSFIGTLKKAAENMINFDKIVDPDIKKTKRYNTLYMDFVEECKKRYRLEDN